jgi:bisphosphoglycerate-independent phosphoglycerate mutase (AlkP superfamily)
MNKKSNALILDGWGKSLTLKYLQSTTPNIPFINSLYKTLSAQLRTDGLNVHRKVKWGNSEVDT